MTSNIVRALGLMDSARKPTRLRERSGLRSFQLLCAFREALIAVAAMSAFFSVAAGATGREATAIKLAVFDFELEDSSAAPGAATIADEVAKSLKAAIEAARSMLAQSGKYVVVSTAAVDSDAAKAHTLRNCNGCEAELAAKLGADQALIGLITKISMMEYTVTIQMRDAKTKTMVATLQTPLRMGAACSWDRGVSWLITNSLLANSAAR